MNKRPKTPYHHESCNIGEELVRLTGGNLGHTPNWSPEGIFIGDSYSVNRITKFPNPEQFDAHIDSFLYGIGFTKTENQPIMRIVEMFPNGEKRTTESHEFTKSGSLRRYTHSNTPSQKYLVSLGISHKLKLAGIEITLESE